MKVITPKKLTKEQKYLIEKLNDTLLEIPELKTFEKFVKKNKE